MFSCPCFFPVHASEVAWQAITAVLAYGEPSSSNFEAVVCHCLFGDCECWKFLKNGAPLCDYQNRRELRIDAQECAYCKQEVFSVGKKKGVFEDLWLSNERIRLRSYSWIVA